MGCLARADTVPRACGSQGMPSAQLRRREFISLLGGASITWPFAANAQQVGKVPTIGLLGANNAAAQSLWTAAFVQRLHELGWIEGRNITWRGC
jgi:hypothetical protein